MRLLKEWEQLMAKEYNGEYELSGWKEAWEDTRIRKNHERLSQAKEGKLSQVAQIRHKCLIFSFFSFLFTQHIVLNFSTEIFFFCICFKLLTS